MLINKPVCLRFSILELSKILVYEFWYDYVTLKYGEKAKFCYMDEDSFSYTQEQMIFIKTLQKNFKLNFMLQIII